MYNQNPQNGQFNGSAPQAGVYPQQSFGAPQPYGAAPMNMPNQPFQPGQNPVQGNGWAQPVPQANPAQSGGQQDRLKYTPAIYEKPESGNSATSSWQICLASMLYVRIILSACSSALPDILPKTFWNTLRIVRKILSFS